MKTSKRSIWTALFKD